MGNKCKQIGKNLTRMLLCLLKKKFKVFNTLIVCRYVTVFLIQFVYSYFWGVGGPKLPCLKD